MPSENEGTLYSGPIIVSSSLTIKAIAYVPNGSPLPSWPVSAHYTIEPLSPPTISGAIAGDGTVTVTWAAVDGARSYNQYWAEGADVTTSSGTKISNASSPQEVGGLTNGKQYAFIVTAVNTAEESPPSPVATPTPGIIVGPTIYAAGYYSSGSTKEP